MTEILVVFISQLSFNFLRALSNRHEAHGIKAKAVILSFFIQILWLVSTSLGVKAMIDSDVTVIISYLLGGTIGVYLNFYIKVGTK